MVFASFDPLTLLRTRTNGIKQIALLLPTLAIVITFLSTSHLNAFELAGRSFYSPRSPSTNAVRSLVGYCNLFVPHEPIEDNWHAMLLATTEYQQSFRNYRIASYYFNSDCIRITGSMTGDRDQNDLLADYFGLSPTFFSNVGMHPTIRNVLFNIDAALGYDRWFVRLQIPAAWTRWHFNLVKEPDNVGRQTAYPAQYMAATTITAPGNSFTQAMAGTLLFGDMQNVWQNGIICGAQQNGGLAEVRCALGCHALAEERYGIDLSLLVATPTSNQSCARYFFEPIHGNGRHTELGIGFDGRVLLWENDGTQTVTLYGTINATHLFSSCQRRSFDFCRNGFFSRYLLLKEFDETKTYTGKLIPGINVTTLPCSVSVSAQFDIVCMIGYLYRGFEFDFGYNAWIRTKEKLCITGCIEENHYGIKGIQNVVDALGNPDNTTQSTATIFGNQLTPAEQIATADANSPVFIRTSDLDPLSGAATSAFTSKLFAHIGYAWHDYCSIEPYIGIGGEIEFEGISPERNLQANNNTVSQWGIWLKGGIGY